MDYVETEGNSIDEAINNALKALGAERSKVEIEILANATRGLFGIGGKKARVRATMRRPLEAALDAPPAERLEPAKKKRTSTAAEMPPSSPTAEVPPARVSAPSSSAEPDPASAALARATLEGLLERMGFAVAVTPTEAEGHAHLAISGDSSGVLIGRHGQTLDALEYFVNRVVAREDEDSSRVVLDCEQYRERRRDSLIEMAHRMAERARKRGKPVALNPMSPRDRRIIHLALREESGLTTRSSGKGHYRKVLIIPERERRGAPPGGD